MSERCKGTTKAGKPCRAYPVSGSDYCQAHDPELAAERAAWRKAGGRASLRGNGEPVQLIDLEDVRQGISAVIGSLWALDNSVARNRALTSALAEGRKMVEVGDLETRIDALEQRIEQLKAVEARMQT